MAAVCGDKQHEAEWSAMAEKSAILQNERLWNGHYYRQVNDSLKPASDYGNACLADQLLGQWWADQIGLGELYPSYQLEKAFSSIFNYNFRSILKGHKQLPREFAKPDEPGLIVCTWPFNDRPSATTAYTDEVWTSQGYNLAANLFKYGRNRDALTLLRAGWQRYDGKLRTGYKGEWGNFGYSGNPFGDDECGQFYSRSLCNWSILLSVQGMSYDGPKGFLAFSPKWEPDTHCSFFSTAAAWGNFSQAVTDGIQQNSLVLSYGKLELNRLRLDNRLGKENVQIEAFLNGKKIKITCVSDKKYVDLYLDTLRLNKSDELKLKMY